MLDDFFSSDIEDLEKKFQFFLKSGKHFYASEEDFIALVLYYSFNNNQQLMQKALELGLKYYPQSSGLLFKKGVSYYDNHRYLEAKKYFVQSYIFDTEDTDCLRYLVLVCVKLKNFVEANNYFQKLLLLLTEEIDAWNIFYHSDQIFLDVLDEDDLWLFFSGNIELNIVEQQLLNYSRELFEQVDIDKNVDDLSDLWYQRLAIFKALSKDFKTAKQYLKQSIENNPYNSNSWLFLALLQLKENDYNDALNSIGYAVAIDEDLGAEQFILARMLFFLMRYNEAIPLLEKLKQSFYYNIWEVDYLLGRCYASMNEYLLAIECYQHCIKVKPNNIAPYLEIAGIYLETNKVQKAYEYLQQCKQINPKEAELLYLFADYYLRTERYADGLRYIDMALEEYPNDIDYVLLKSELLIANNNTSEGLNVLNHYLYEYQEAAIIYYRIAGIYVEMNEVDNAYRFLKLGVKKDPKLLDDFFQEYPEAKKISKLALFLNARKK